MNAVLILLVAAALLLPSATPAQQEPDGQCYTYRCYPPDSCLKMIFPDEPEGKVFVNPDSVRIDSCAELSGQFDHYDHMYAREWFYIEIFEPIIKIPKKDTFSPPLDTTWEAVSVEYPLARQKFQELEQRFGPNILRKQSPFYDFSHPAGRDYRISFKNYVPMDTVCFSFFTEINNLMRIGYAERFGVMIGVTDEPASKLSNISVTSNPAMTELRIRISTSLMPYEAAHIYSITGELVCIGEKRLWRPEESIALDISGLPAGTYMLRIGSFRHPFIILR